MRFFRMHYVITIYKTKILVFLTGKKKIIGILIRIENLTLKGVLLYTVPSHYFTSSRLRA